MHSDKIDFNMVKQKFMQNGLKVVNIHPMHFALNTPYFQYTRQIKVKLTRNEWVGMDENMLEDLKYKGKGITNFIIQLMDLVKVQNIKIITLEQAYKMCI